MSAIEALFERCCNSLTHSVDLKGVMRLLWPVLDNSLSMIDIANCYNICISNNSSSGSSKDCLDMRLFKEWFSSVARLKFPSSADYVNLLVDAVNDGVVHKVMETPFLAKAFDKNVCRVLLKFDLPLRRAFSGFAGQGSNIGAGVTWDEVKGLNMGMEVDGWTSFCSACSIMPDPVSLEQCKLMAKETLKEFPSVAAAASQHSVLMYPAFQLSLCRLAIELQHYESSSGGAENDRASTKAQTINTKRFAKKVQVQDIVPLANLLQSLLRNIGIDKLGPTNNFSFQEGGGLNGAGGDFESSLGFEHDSAPVDGGAASGGGGEISMPQSTRPDDQYQQYLNQGRMTIQLRLEHLFDEVETKLIQAADPESGLFDLVHSAKEEQELMARSDSFNQHKYASKPVVIGDALPIPTDCPEEVEQLLEAALAHHNLGSYEESLKFLEASRLQLEEIEVARKGEELRAKVSSASVEEDDETGSATATQTEAQTGASLEEGSEFFAVVLPLDVEMYIALCKGNVYQSSGDDENAMQQYVNAWARASLAGDKEWQVVCINSIGMLAYYSLRYEVAIMCFFEVVRHRTEAYGAEAVDTCTAVNNEGCALFAMGSRSAARLRFERTWNAMCKTLGHRHPRCIASWKNLERCKRITSSLRKSELHESVGLRADADHLLYGENHKINAIPPPEAAKKGKKGKGGGGKKGKKKK